MSLVSGLETPIELDWRFAELVVRTWMEPELGVRYQTDPVSVLAEFGLSVVDPALAPKLAAHPESELVIEDLEGSKADFGKVKSCASCVACVNDQPLIAGDKTGPAQRP